jgi:galactose mutarotase-like enzyme
LKITLQNQNLVVAIQSKGAELCSLKNANSNREFLWQADPSHWAKHAPVLFPIVGTLKNNSYLHEEKNYSLPRHGFARDLEFTLLEQSETQAVFQLLSSASTLKVYPFLFDFRITYTLQANALITQYSIHNLGEEKMYYNVGAHPAFALPLAFSDYQLEFSADSELTAYALSADLISQTTHPILLHNHKLPFDYSLFEKDALVFKQLNSNAVTLLENGNPLLEVGFTDFPNLGLWTKPQAPFICIEPWLGYADTVDASGVLSEKEGIQHLAAKQQKTVKFITTLFA